MLVTEQRIRCAAKQASPRYGTVVGELPSGGIKIESCVGDFMNGEFDASC
jgi:hypothetical protein